MFPHPTTALSTLADMFKRGSKSPSKTSAAPDLTVEEDCKAKRISTVDKFNRVLGWTSLHEGKSCQLEDLAKITLRNGEKPSKELEARIIHFKDTIAVAQADFRNASRYFDDWTLARHEVLGKYFEAKVEATWSSR
ncbi:hypothetical protein E8E11_008938 [Didymella keratinophila]|nr:hypothetical protein E8E11_008938 [Didymella keratinophila]